MLSQKAIAAKQKKVLLKKKAKMMEKMKRAHEKQMKILMQKEKREIERASKSVGKQREIETFLKKRREDEKKFRASLGPEQFKSLEKASMELSQKNRLSPSSSSLSAVESPEKIAAKARREELKQKQRRREREEELKRNREELRRQTENLFRMHSEKIKEKEMHMKARDDAKQQMRMVQQRKREIATAEKTKAMAERLNKAMKSQEDLLKAKYQKFKQREEDRYFRQVELDFLEELKREETKKRQALLMEKRQLIQARKVETEKARVDDLLRREMLMEERIAAHSDEMQRQWQAMRYEREIQHQHSVEVYNRMKRKVTEKSDGLLEQRRATEERMKQFHQDMERSLYALKEEAHCRDRDRLEVRNRVYDAQKERAEMIETIQHSRSQRHEFMLEVIEAERAARVQATARVREEKIAKQRDRAAKYAVERETILKERAFEREQRSKDISARASMDGLGGLDGGAAMVLGSTSVGGGHGSHTRRGGGSKYTVGLGSEKSPPRRKAKTSEGLLRGLEGLRDRQAWQMDQILQEEEEKETGRVNFEMSIDNLKDRRQATKDYGRQRILAVQRIQRIREENEIVLFQKLNEYHKLKFKEDQAMEELQATIDSFHDD